MTEAATKPAGGWAAAILGIVVIACGIAFVAGGGYLVALSGSPYYLVTGILLLVAGAMALRGRALGGYLYAAFLLVTLAWGFAEAGAEPWALTARLFAPALLGLLFLLPPVSRKLGKGALGAGLAGAIGVIAVIGCFALRDSHDVRNTVPAGALAAVPEDAAGDEWTAWGGTRSGARFSRLDQITPANVGKLESAWTFHTGIAPDAASGYLSATPLMVDGKLYLCAQDNSVFALDPETGKTIWKVDPKVSPKGASAVRTCRGVSYVRTAADGVCAGRIVSATFDGRLMELDAADGKPCPGFGKNGVVNLYAGMGVVNPGFYYSSAPPAIANGKIVIGGWVADNQSTDEPSGVIRGFDLLTGELAWAWDAGNPANVHGPAAGQAYSRSTPNAWAVMSADEKLGLVYVATGNPTPDHYGALRSPASEKYGSSVVAIDVASGAVRWSFQTAHHDLWDYDVPAQPTLFTLNKGGAQFPAIAISTKRAEIFVLDRRTGQPLIPITEKPAPQRGAVEKLAPTQPYSAVHSMAGPDLTEAAMWGLTPFDQLWCRVRLKQLRYDGKVTPPGLDEALIYPSIGGGMNFGGVAIDPMRRLLVTNALYYGTIVQMVPRAETEKLRAAVDSHSVTSFGVPLPQEGTPFGVRLTPFASPLGVPCNNPPFGRIAAMNLDTGKLAWERPFGTARDAGPFGMALGLPLAMGAPNFGGALTTASGLTFIGAAREKAFRAFDTRTGDELWSVRLPASAQTLPMTYRGPRDGCQYVAVTAGGHNMLQSPLSDTVVAFRLPGCKDGHSRGNPVK
ncbi:membrane-bound PQQ-dependent dehydrogenase, glucose/quinate/shikimate family [Novosphingobium colocasiae]|uniref:Quinate dehydrogenase n=1 Tax=Novosphingobium colocasiae TaxID=1256513 RepID=A0A918UD02_9SPHN|nr:membrane-bound PQQ-dependent dehydrogenase, glucose/quinate/shikimate family [Novosphingobium colocasiae]GGY90283.1 quinate dehydrogenase [Novosphingobium colocasiae]